MASKTKIRCATCGKWFQSANAKETMCPDCAQKARKEKLAAKSAPPTPVKAPVVQHTPPKPKPQHVQSGTNQWLDNLSDVKVAQPEPPVRPKIISSPKLPDTHGAQQGENNNDSREDSQPGNYRDRDSINRGPGGYRPPTAPYRVGGGSGLPDTPARPRQPMEGGFRGPRPDYPGGPRQDRQERSGRPTGQSKPKGGKPKVKTPKPPPAPKPKREKIEPPKPFEPTAEQITQIEARYLELATPVEFDGIRTQIAQELSIPKTAVKKVIKELRDKQNIPSWWEAMSYKGSEEDLAKIKGAYEPFLPLPEVGIHKTIAETLSMKPSDVYQAIKKLRADMGLPQYNDPELHPELKEQEKKKDQRSEDKAVAASTEQPANDVVVPTDTVSGTDTEAVVESLKQNDVPDAQDEPKGDTSKDEPAAVLSNDKPVTEAKENGAKADTDKTDTQE